MGHDPFWPTSLATVNVLVVPASPVTPARFEQIYKSLRQVSSINLSDVHLNLYDNELLLSTESRTGTLFLDYSTNLPEQNVRRVPFELNARPQIIIGVHDGLDPKFQSQEERSALLHSAGSGLSTFSSQWRHECATVLLIREPDLLDVDDEVVNVTDWADGQSILVALTKVAGTFIQKAVALTRTLGDVQIEDPRVVSLNTDGAGKNQSQDAIPSDLREEVDGQQTSADPANITLQSVDRQKGRLTVSIGMLNLLVGSWPDAMRRLSEGASLTAESADGLWHARAIEGLLVCMTLQAWRGGDFTIPELFDPAKAYAASQMSLRSRSSSITARITAIAQRSDVSKLRPIEKWFQLAPFVANLALDLYSSVKDRDLPQILLLEARLRLVNVLIFCQVSKGDEASLSRYILNRHLTSQKQTPKLSHVSDLNLASMIIDIAISAEMIHDVVQTIKVLTAAASSLASLGSRRKQAFVFRDLLLKLGPALMKARKLGASEAGIHPAAVFSTTTTSSDSNFRSGSDVWSLLRAVMLASDIALLDVKKDSDLSAPLPRRSRLWLYHHLSGDLPLKLEVLQSCLSICDAMLDTQASLVLTSTLLMLSIRSPTVSAISSNITPWLTLEDQTLYVDSIKRLHAAARRQGTSNVAAAYWDSLLVRDVRLHRSQNTSQLTSHQPDDLSVISNVALDGPTRDPFIFNPFAKTVSINAAPLIVAGELVTISVLLQNPLEVEIDIIDIRLLAEGCDFEATQHSMLLGKFCSQLFTLTGIARTSGVLKIIGCRALIDGCHEQDFLVYREDWQPPVQVKQKSKSGTMPESDDMESSTDLKIPQPGTLSLRVIDPQPQVDLISPALTQPSIMLMDGERKSLEIWVKNASESISADFVLFTFHDNVTSNLQEILRGKDLTPFDTFEMQHQLKHKPAMQSAGEDDCGEISPKATIRRRFDIFGVPGLQSAAFQVNFAHLGKRRSEVKETFYTRQTSFPVSVTVNGSIEIVRCNLHPIGDDFAFESGSSRAKAGSQSDGYCLLSIDLRNVWPQPLSVSMSSKSAVQGQNSGEHVRDEHDFTDKVQPGHTCRALLLVPRVFVQDVHAPIPSLVTQRQFVISTSKLSLEAEAASREAFWYREALLQCLSGSWTEETTDRRGEIDLRRGIRMTPRMIDVLKVECVDISFSLKPNSETTTNTYNEIFTRGKASFTLPVETFATLSIHVHNRSTEPLSLLLRLQPSLKSQPHNIALDLSRRFMYTGLLQRPLHPAIESGETREANLGVIPLAAGRYVVHATVEEIKGRQQVGQPSSNGVIGIRPERRIWHAKAPCVIEAIETRLDDLKHKIDDG